MSDPVPAELAGPKALCITQISWRGPFAARGLRMALYPARFSIVNPGHDVCVLDRLLIDPLRRDATGTDAESELTLQAGAEEVAPEAFLALTLKGEIPARPGAYGTVARVVTRTTAPLAIPVTITVPASPVWGVLCMLLGLVLLGTVNLLAGEGSVKARLHDALRARQDIHTLLEADPAPQSRAGDVEAMDHDFDAAIAGLGGRRPVSVVDHRQEEAATHLQAAGVRAEKLRTDLAGRPAGSAEIDDVQHDWAALQPTLQAIAALPKAMPTPPEPGLAGRLDAFLLRFRRELLQDPAANTAAEITTELGRMALQEAAGEGTAARDLALTTRLWLRRSALSLNRALTSYRTALAEAGWMLNTDRVMRERAAHDNMAPEDRQAVLAKLDEAAAKLEGDAWLGEWRDAHVAMNAAWTAQVRGDASMLKHRVDDIIADVGRQTDYTDVQDLTDRLQATPGPHTLAMKQAGLSQILALWRVHAAGVGEAPARESFRHQIDAIQALVDAGKLTAMSALYRSLLSDWAAWHSHLVQLALDRLDHPRCLGEFADLQRNTAAMEAVLRERPPGADGDAWDRVLDGIRVDMQRRGPDAETVSHDCMTPLLDIGARANALSAAIFTASLVDIPLPAATRLRLAQASGVASAMATTEANLTRPRSLVLHVDTPFDERVAGRELGFSLLGADPVWGSATTIRVDFGSGEPGFMANAEQLRQGRRMTHVYAGQRTAHLTVTATADPRPGEPAGTLLGEGHATLLVAPNPVTGAQILADAFINLRFGLALLIALTVYYWRYHTRNAVFGARGYDYVEAFALGFAADAAVANLPDLVAKLAPG